VEVVMASEKGKVYIYEGPCNRCDAKLIRAEIVDDEGRFPYVWIQCPVCNATFNYLKAG
jgi:nitrite reductase/ring-hydroxylating ferredoxin subunit